MCWMTGGGFQTRSLERIQRQEMEDILNDFDPIQAPPGPYKLQPEKKGETKQVVGFRSQ